MSSPALQVAPNFPAKPWKLPLRGMAVFYGCPQVPRLSHYFLPRAIAEGKRILYLDGANRFDPLLLARLARQRGNMPSEWNSHVRTARAFTCFQLTELLVRAPRLLQSFPADVAILTAMPELYFDEDVREADAISSFQQGLRALRQLAARLPVAVFSDPGSFSTPRRKLFEQVRACARQTGKFTEQEDDTLTFSDESIVTRTSLLAGS
ncbi:MAG: hypothetical protein WBE20_09840 [Candidatus Acidiferrales bacterium]